MRRVAGRAPPAIWTISVDPDEPAETARSRGPETHPGARKRFDGPSVLLAGSVDWCALTRERQHSPQEPRRHEMSQATVSEAGVARSSTATKKDSLTVIDNRTGKTYELPITNGTTRAMDLRQIRVSADDFGLMSYDPAFMNTASCTSRITYIDGDKGILRYRGYPIEQLAEKSTYLETAYLILFGELPSQS